MDQRNGPVHKCNAANDTPKLFNVRNHGRQSVRPCYVQCCAAVLRDKIGVLSVWLVSLPIEEPLQVSRLEYLRIRAGPDFNITHVFCLPFFPSMCHRNRIWNRDQPVSASSKNQLRFNGHAAQVGIPNRRVCATAVRSHLLCAFPFIARSTLGGEKGIVYTRNSSANTNPGKSLAYVVNLGIQLV